MDFAAHAFLPLKSRICLLADQACKLYYAHQIDQILGEASLDKASLFAEAMQLVDSIPDEQVKQSQLDPLFQRYETYCRGQIDQFIAQGHPEEAIAFANRALPLAKEDTLEIARQACDTYYDRQARALHSKDVEKAMALAEKIENRWKKQACVRHLAPVYEPYCRAHLKSSLSAGHLNEAAKKLGDLPNSSFKEEQMAILLQKYQHRVLSLIESNRADKAMDFAKTRPNIRLSVTLSCGERSSIIRDRYLQDILEGAASAACDQYYKTQIDKKFAKLKLERAERILAGAWKLTEKIQDEKLKKIYRTEIHLLNEVRKNWTPELLKYAADLPYPTLEKEEALKKEPSIDLASRYIQRRHAQIISYLKNDKPNLAMQCALRTAFPELRQAIVEGSKRACDRYYEAQIDTVLKQNLKHFEDRSQALKVVAQIQDPALKEVYRAKISATYTDAYTQKRALEELAKRPHEAEKYALQIKDKKSREECLEKIGDQMHSNRLDRLFQQEGSSPAEIRSCIQKIRCAALREVKETARKAYYVRQVELLFRKKAKKTLAKKYFDDLSPEAQQTALRACQAPTNHRSSYLTQFTGFVSTLGDYDSD